MRTIRKLAGTFQVNGDDSPAWSSFSTLIDYTDLDEAAECSRRTGRKWVLYLTADPDKPITDHAEAVRERVEAAGLRPYLLAIADNEEWYEHVLSGTWPSFPAATIHAWAGQRNAQLKNVFPGLPIVWITTLANDSKAYGDVWWRPVPDGVSVIGLEAYVPSGKTWNATAGRYLAHALNTRPEQIALITQGFRDPRDPHWVDGPTADVFAGTTRALLHPRVIASWLFTWDGSLWGGEMVGLKQRPDWQLAYESAIGVAQ